MSDNHEETLAYTQDFRRRLLDRFINDGEVPDDPKVANLLRMILSDMDRQVIDDRKTKVDERNAETNEGLFAGFTEFINRQQNQSVFEVATPLQGEVVRHDMPPELMAEYTPVDGEEHIGTVEETSDEFYKRLERD